MKLYVDGGPSSTQTVGHLRMEGREVFKHAVGMITDVIEDAFAATGYTAARPRLVRAAPGQSPHHRRLGAQARHRPGQKVDHHRRPARQHLGRVDSARALRRASPTGASRRAISCCSRRWAAASPGVPRWCACKRDAGSGAAVSHGQLPAPQSQEGKLEIPRGCVPFFG